MMMKKTLLMMMGYVLTFGAFAQVTNDSRVLLQGFYWEASHDYTEDWYEYVESKASDISSAGIDMIWLPPPSDAGSLEGYLPRELNNFANSYGTLSEHQSLLSTLDGLGIEAIADIVINHRIGSTNWVDFTNPTWGTNAITADDEVWSESDYSSITLRGNNDTGTSYAAARDLDHTQTFVQTDIKSFLDNLKALGYDGWRYDFVHGFDPYYFTVYNGYTNPTFSVGENWSQDKQTIQDWIDATGSTAFDFATYYTLKGVIRDNNYSYLAYEGAPSGGIGWDPKNYTTFVENHDTPDYDSGNNVLTSTNVGQAYAYLLTHPGVPCIFWSHLYEWGSSVTAEIKALIEIRKDAGIHSQSAVTIQESESGLYVAAVEGDNYTVYLKMGYTDWGDPAAEGIDGSWDLAASGNNYAVWIEGDGSGGTDSSSMTVYAQDYTYAYAWDDDSNQLLGSWPGTAMTTNSSGWNEVTVAAECSNIIFSYAGSSQTSDLSTCADTPYFYEGQWYATDPLESSSSSTLTVYAQGYTHCYAWDSNGATLGAWPGTAMTDEGNGWNSITISDSCSNVIFSYSGSSQTADLYACGPEAYWLNGSWSTSSSRVAYFSEESVSIYPNPFFGEATVSFSLDEASYVQVEVFNTAGQSVKLVSKNYAKGDHQILLTSSALPPSQAMYIVRLSIDGEVFSHKLMMK